MDSYFGYIDECQYLSGIVAGFATKTNKLGFVAAKPIPQVLRNINAFTLGARSVDPKIECHRDLHRRLVAADQGRRGRQSLVDQGVDVFTCHVDGPKVVVESGREARQVRVRLPRQPGEAGPEGLYLTGAEWNWDKVYTDFVNDVKAGKKITNIVRGGLKEGIVKTSAYGPTVSDEAKKKADEVRRKLVEGNFVDLQGSAEGQQRQGDHPRGKVYAQNDLELEKMNYLVEGVMVKK